MKKYILLLIFNLCLFSCYPQRSFSDIVYFLPSSVNEILIKEIQKSGNNNDIYMVLDKENTDTYILYLSNNNSPKNFWKEHTNRAVFLQEKLIPLYFYSDEYFSFAEKGEDILKKLGTEKGIKKVTYLRENVFNIKFKLNGEIVDE
ncbi:hypothetical protein WH221_18245 [Chryseobacterium culicis]|uniref:Uncharacterized protein n=1 Tax=Chryseobacterium culicis TaxID=680127 RepID=A0A2S9CQ37_CHRCI|nr:hypothetical protein [Chryseobacterium culicis]PRB82616.1 hypothetical protein CQ022_18195 [Chryseobacterium culicis]PRB88991.1 hypothetical protein CQ033_17090 [Chryseobacterium culicis]